MIAYSVVIHIYNRHVMRFRQGEKWYHLRKNLTVDLTSPQTMQGFLPNLNNICDDFLELLQSCRKRDQSVTGFEQLTNRMGLECKTF